MKRVPLGGRGAFLQILFLQILFLDHLAVRCQKNVSDQALDAFLSRLYLDDDQKPGADDVKVKFQGQVDQHHLEDMAMERLFTFVSPKLLSKPLYSTFIALFDNYIADTRFEEQESSEEKMEIVSFLSQLSATKVFQSTYEFLHSIGHPFAESKLKFAASFKSLWFTNYARYTNNVIDTSSFEHVFVGEILRKRKRKRRTSGMHNWLRFYKLEQSGQVNYAGYVLKRPNLALTAFTRGNLWESIGGFMLGTSPAFDMAAFTVCFWLRPNRQNCRFRIDQCAISIRNYVIRRDGFTAIGTIYPAPGKATAACKRISRGLL